MHPKNLVPEAGFEPARLSAPPPQDGASTNFAIRADANNFLPWACNHRHKSVR